MKVVAFNGSARKDGNTAQLVRVVFEELEREGIETELIQMSGTHPHGCLACGACARNKDQRCIQTGDPMNEWIAKMVEADGIILASPTYFADVSTEMKALIDRAGYVGLANGGLYKRKVGAPVVAVRRGGAIHAVDTINHLFQISQMIIPCTRYWNFGFGRNIGEVQQDEEGILTMRTLGENMAWLMQKLAV